MNTANLDMADKHGVKAAEENRPDSLNELNAVLEECLISCFQYLVCEQGWEFFRAAMLNGGNKEYDRQSQKNAESLRRFIRDQSNTHPHIAEIAKRAERRQYP